VIKESEFTAFDIINLFLLQTSVFSAIKRLKSVSKLESKINGQKNFEHKKTLFF